MSFSRRLNIALVALVCSWAVLGVEGTKYERNDATHVGADWLSGPEQPPGGIEKDKILKDVPQYVLDYAPLIHLYSREPFWPGLMDEHLEHTTPYLNDFAVDELEQNLGLDELEKLNEHSPPWWVFLKSNDHVKNDHPTDFPQWLIGKANIPVDSGENWDGDDDQVDDVDKNDDWSEWFDVGAPDERAKQEQDVPSFSSKQAMANFSSNIYSPGGRSLAPVVLIVVEKDNGVVDAFWFYFYHYNLGNSVFSIRFGNHVGDWEHNMIRFHKGVPKAVFFSEHAGGASYTYEAVEKIGKRPRVYSATGTHAMYATQGIHPYVLPFKILHDTTDRGPLWDPLRNLYAYHYNTTIAGEEDRGIWSVRGENIPSSLSVSAEEPQTLTPSSLTPEIPTSWFYYRGHWGDKNFNKSDPRQYAVFGEKAYVSGPMGPRWKALGRRMMCSSQFSCSVRTSIEPIHWFWQFTIDMLKLCGLLLVLAGVISAIVWSLRCCIYYGSRGSRRIVGIRQRKVEGDVEEPIIVVEDETSPLLSNGSGHEYQSERSPLLVPGTAVDREDLDAAR